MFVVFQLGVYYAQAMLTALFLYFILPLALCTAVGARRGASRGRPWRGTGIGFAVGFCTMIAALTWLLFIAPDDIPGSSLMWVVPIVIALVAAVVTGGLTRRTAGGSERQGEA